MKDQDKVDEFFKELQKILNKLALNDVEVAMKLVEIERRLDLLEDKGKLH